MKRFWTPLTIAAVFCTLPLFLTGCDNKSSHAVAVVDLDAVAKALGKDQTLTKQLQDVNNDINQQLTKIGQSYQQQLKDASDKAGPKPSDQDKKNLQAMQNDAQQKFAAYQQAGANKLRETQAKLADDFRNEVKPFAERFARQKGAGVVMVSTGMILWMDNQLDITGDVITAMRAAPAAPAPATSDAPQSAPAPAPAPKQ